MHPVTHARTVEHTQALHAHYLIIIVLVYSSSTFERQKQLMNIKIYLRHGFWHRHQTVALPLTQTSNNHISRKKRSLSQCQINHSTIVNLFSLLENKWQYNLKLWVVVSVIECIIYHTFWRIYSLSYLSVKSYLFQSHTQKTFNDFFF